MYKSSTKNRKLKNLSLSQYPVYTAHCENRSICVDVHNGIFMVYQYFYDIPVFLRYVGLPVYNFLLHIDTGMTKIPSFRFFCGISPSSMLFVTKAIPISNTVSRNWKQRE